MKAADVRKHIKSGETGPLYLLEGDDLQSRHDLAVEFGSLVDEGLHAFNVQTFYANEATNASARDQMIGELLAAARTLPMMASRRVLIVHEAERLLSPRKGKDDDDPPSDAPAGKRRRTATPAEELEAYFESPEPLTTLVFAAGDLDANRRLVKVLRKHAVSVDCGTLDTQADAAKWIRARVEKDGQTVEPQAITLLLEATGLTLGRIRAELDKLLLFASGEPALTAKHVKEMVLPLTEPGAEFALGRAIWNNNARDALREIAAELEAGKPPFMILGMMRAAVVRLRSDDRIRSGLDAVLRTDLAIKSSAGDARHQLERLAIELCAR